MSMKFLLSTLLLPVLAAAAILPDAIGDFHRTATSRPALVDRGLWDEYGLKSAEAAAYQSGTAKLDVTVWQLPDSTAAMAAFEWQRPADSKPLTLGNMAAETADSLIFTEGNYLISFSGGKPGKPEIDALVQSLKNVDNTSLPVLPGYLPSDGLVPNSERYITGPVGLARFDGAIPPSVAAFHFGAEGQLGVFHTAKGDMTMVIFNYPTPQIARQQTSAFGKLPGAVVKRSGPLVAVTLAPPDPDAAERILGQVRYQAVVTRDEYVPTRRDNVGELLLNAFILIGILLAFSIVSGIVAGGLRALWRRGKSPDELEPMITLHLENR
jgi:Family of unknown function (DUF6599)